MENTTRDSAPKTDPQNDWQNAERNASTDADTRMDLLSVKATDETDDKRQYATDKDKEEEIKASEEEENGDWGHVDPAESNSPFPDSNEPSAPGSAV